MSWISIGLILICIVTGIRGYRRGFTKTVVSMISFLIIMLLVSILNPLLSGIVERYTDLGEKTEQYCLEAMTGHLESETELGRNEQISWIEELPIPEQIKTELVENNNNVIYEVLDAANFFGYIASYLSKLILRAIVYLISIIAAWLIVKIVSLCISGVAHMPVIGFFNRIAGFGLGVVKGMLVVWILFLGVTIFSGTGAGSTLLVQIRQDAVANVLYEKNPLIWLLILFFLV